MTDHRMTQPDCLFCRIVAGDVPADVVFRDDDVIAFRDIAPKAPVHVLVIPRSHHADLAELVRADADRAGALLRAAAQVAASEGLAGDGYRVLFNTGRNAGQEVFHVHAHILGGAPLGPMVARAAR